MRDPIDVRRRIADAISRYLAEHPEAADIEQGIADWWLPASATPVSLDEVREALELLVDEGVVEKRLLMGGRAIYRAAHPPGKAIN
ncbi:hypothetical protein [Niveibacterium sp. SC-1]|uniref:hypothetical protein n=1 Tax=Niveibacterium sp. SC-1 TaxID=3135646 RepID=UPI00311D5870